MISSSPMHPGTLAPASRHSQAVTTEKPKRMPESWQLARAATTVDTAARI